MGKILSISLKLNFTPNILSCYGLMNVGSIAIMFFKHQVTRNSKACYSDDIFLQKLKSEVNVKSQ